MRGIVIDIFFHGICVKYGNRGVLVLSSDVEAGSILAPDLKHKKIDNSYTKIEDNSNVLISEWGKYNGKTQYKFNLNDEVNVNFIMNSDRVNIIPIIERMPGEIFEMKVVNQLFRKNIVMKKDDSNNISILLYKDNVDNKYKIPNPKQARISYNEKDVINRFDDKIIETELSDAILYPLENIVLDVKDQTNIMIIYPESKTSKGLTHDIKFVNEFIYKDGITIKHFVHEDIVEHAHIHYIIPYYKKINLGKVYRVVGKRPSLPEFSFTLYNNNIKVITYDFTKDTDPAFYSLYNNKVITNNTNQPTYVDGLDVDNQDLFYIQFLRKNMRKILQ